MDRGSVIRLGIVVALGMSGGLGGYWNACGQAGAPSRADDVEQTIAALLDDWRTQSAAYHGADRSVLMQLDCYSAIVALGPCAIPHLLDEIQAVGPVAPLGSLLEDITKMPWTARGLRHFRGGRPPGEVLSAQRDEIMGWWERGPGGVREEFERLKVEWTERVPEGADRVWLYRVETSLVVGYGHLSSTQPIPTDAGRTYLAVEALGIAVLPILLEEVEAGNVEWLPLILRLTDGAPPVNSMLSAEMRVAQVREWWDANKQEWLIPWPEDEAEE